MKKILMGWLIVLCLGQLEANNFYGQLCAFNPNWTKYSSVAPKGGEQHFASDREYIQAHLKSVLTILRSNPTNHLNPSQKRSRMHLMQVLDAYRQAGRFPMNYYRRERIPVFIDEHNTHCAVGYLLLQTGYGQVAKRISVKNNYAWVREIDDAGLLAWQQTSGFTLEELKLIQGAYDSYLDNAFILANKYEVPQKPTPIKAYFDKTKGGGRHIASNLWLYGQGVNGVLNGRWVQNFAPGIPWIEGYYENGKRSGQWKEYYQGTNQLCRTESWKEDKLNGTRIRFNQWGDVIEEIVFADGKAITKTNYERSDSLIYVRRPIDSVTVWTTVYDFNHALLAKGMEKVHNPGNLQWFQNIELTALNSMAITVRDMGNSNNGGFSNVNGNVFIPNPYNQSLVTYTKQGEWVYYKELSNGRSAQTGSALANNLYKHYRHFALPIYNSIFHYDNYIAVSVFDSILMVYSDDLLQDFYGYKRQEYMHIGLEYFAADTIIERRFSRYIPKFLTIVRPPALKAIGQYNAANEKMGTWMHYDKNGMMYKTETFLIPKKEEEVSTLPSQQAGGPASQGDSAGRKEVQPSGQSASKTSGVSKQSLKYNPRVRALNFFTLFAPFAVRVSVFSARKPNRSVKH